jgi:hypothetical protein
LTRILFVLLLHIPLYGTTISGASRYPKFGQEGLQDQTPVLTGNNVTQNTGPDEPLPALHSSQCVDFYLNMLDTILDKKTEADIPAEAIDSQKQILHALSLLRDTMKHEQDYLVRNGSKQILNVEPRNVPVFGKRISLPPEHKSGSQWSFSPVNIPIFPPNLWMYGLTFKGDRTLRIQKVTFIFRDGKKQVWVPARQKNQETGTSFKKDKWLPFMSFSAEETTPKLLREICILGSAQDGIYSAKLDFLFRIPDPGKNENKSLILSLDRLINKTRLGKNTRKAVASLIIKIRKAHIHPS